MAKQLVTVMLCTNDPDNGADTGHVCAVDVHDEDIELKDWFTPTSHQVVCRVENGKLQFGRRRFRVYSHGDWVGNWCWRAVRITRADCRKLLAYALAHGFSLDQSADDSDLLPEATTNG